MTNLSFVFKKKKDINLLPRDKFESSLLGVILEWGLAFGKWAVIVTQLLVMMAFLWRFGLDRKLTNLKKSIVQEKAVVDSYKDFEKDFRLTQKSLIEAKKVIKSEKELIELIELIREITPEDVWYERLSITKESINIKAYSSSLNGFNRYLSRLQREPKFFRINVATIESGGGHQAQLAFNIILTYAQKDKSK